MIDEGIRPLSDSSGTGAPEPRAELPEGLSERDARILDFERNWWQHAGAKEKAVREEFGFSATRYYQVLGTLIDSPAALVYDPMLIKRLQRIRDARIAARSARLFSRDD